MQPNRFNDIYALEAERYDAIDEENKGPAVNIEKDQLKPARGRKKVALNPTFEELYEAFKDKVSSWRI
jgi:hypothetical protein